MHACAHIGQVKYGWEQEAGEQEKERERERGEREGRDERRGASLRARAIGTRRKGNER